MACGFRNREHFRTAIYFHCGGLELYPATPRNSRMSLIDKLSAEQAGRSTHRWRRLQAEQIEDGGGGVEHADLLP